MGQIKVTKCDIEGLCVIEPTVHGDDRGYFMETYNLNDMKEAGLDMVFVQDNQSMSTKGVLRGLHYQKEYPQGKLVRVIKGTVFDVAVDLRRDSKTYGKWYGVELSEENKKQFYIPEGFAHGFLVPLENYREMMEKTISAKTSDFQQDEETNLPKVMDGQKVIIGGMITDKTIKYTKNNKVMAFLTVEDLVGTVEVVVFPRDYEKSQQFLNEEGRVFIQGRVSAEDDRASKLILEKIRPFDNMPREIWIQFDNKESYTQQSQELLADLRRSPGDSAVVIYLKDVKAIKKLPVGYHAQIQDSWLNYMYEKYGKTNVKVVERGLKNL